MPTAINFKIYCVAYSQQAAQNKLEKYCVEYSQQAAQNKYIICLLIKTYQDPKTKNKQKEKGIGVALPTAYNF